MIMPSFLPQPSCEQLTPQVAQYDAVLYTLNDLLSSHGCRLQRRRTTSENYPVLLAQYLHA
jgi:hypothetical protein